MARRIVQDKYYSGIVIQCGKCYKVLSSGCSEITFAEEDALSNGAVIVEEGDSKKGFVEDGCKFHCKKCTKISRRTGKRKRRE